MISHCMIFDKEASSEGEIIMATQGDGISWQSPNSVALTLVDVEGWNIQHS